MEVVIMQNFKEVTKECHENTHFCQVQTHTLVISLKYVLVMERILCMILSTYHVTLQKVDQNLTLKYNFDFDLPHVGVTEKLSRGHQKWHER